MFCTASVWASDTCLQGCQAEAQADHDAEEEDHDDAVPRDGGPAAVVAAAVVRPRGRHAAGSAAGARAHHFGWPLRSIKSAAGLCACVSRRRACTLSAAGAEGCRKRRDR